MAMASPCLANLSSLRLVNVSSSSFGFSPYSQAFYSLHYGSGPTNTQKEENQESSEIRNNKTDLSKNTGNGASSECNESGGISDISASQNSDSHSSNSDNDINGVTKSDTNPTNSHNNGNSQTQKITPSEDDLLYISETISTGPRMNFGVISLPTIAQRTFLVRVKFWGYSPSLGSPSFPFCTKDSRFSLFYDVSLDVRNLVVLEKNHDLDVDTVFAPNAIVWTFDGIDYCLRTDLQEGYLEKCSKSTRGHRRVQSKSSKHSKSQKPPKTSYSVDDVRHMSSLIIGLRDFDEIKRNASAEIDILQNNLEKQNLVSAIDERERLLHSIAHLDKLILRQESANEALESEILALRNGVKKTASIINNEFPAFERLTREKTDIVSSQVAPLRESLVNSIYPHILSRTQSIVSELVNAFPITLADNSIGHYCISGIEFPSSIKEILSVCYDEIPTLQNGGSEKPSGSLVSGPPTDPTHAYVSSVDCVNAGLSEIVAVMNFLSSVVGVDLKYEMSFSGSQSVLIEHLSPQQVVSNNMSTPAAMHVSPTVTYPLYYDIEQSEKLSEGFVVAEGHKHARNVRFERGLALLTRNLSIFVSEISALYLEYTGDDRSGSLANNIPLDCIDHFLWNLHYLMLFVTAPTK